MVSLRHRRAFCRWMGDTVAERLEREDRNLAMELLLGKLDDIIAEMSGGIWIRTAICRLRDGLSPDECLEQW